jgi:transposase
VEGLLTFSYHEHVEERVVRGYGGRATEVREEREIRVEAVIDEKALYQAIASLGWQIYATNAPLSQFSLSTLVLAYRGEYRISHDFGRLKGQPCSLRPLYLASPHRLKGLLRLLALRVLILVEFEVRQKLAARGEKLTGLYAGQPTRSTARPTAEKLLHAFNGITLTKVIQGKEQYWHITPLSDVQKAILELLSLPADLFSRMVATSRRLVCTC